MCFFVQTNHTRKELLFLMFSEINLRNHSSLHKLFYGLAYDYVVKDNEYKKIIQHKKEILQNVSPETRSMFTFHVIKSESINFAQIQKEDPYFERAHLYDDFDEFISAINANMALNSQDVASYILRKYPQVNDHRFAFDKILYYNI